MPTISAATNPNLARDVLDKALADVQPQGTTQQTAPGEQKEARPPTPIGPLDNLVELPFGYRDDMGELHRSAEVRELTGVDEEILARIPASSPVRQLNSILERGVIRVGPHQATSDILDRMLVADRDLLLLAIRRVTYGGHIEIQATCPDCRNEQVTSIPLESIPIKLPEDPDERELALDLRAGSAVLRLPTGKVHRDIGAAGDKNSAELNTILIAGCLRSINGVRINGPAQARALSMRDRHSVLEAISERMYGPQFDETSVTCMDCGKEIPLILTMSALFRL